VATVDFIFTGSGALPAGLTVVAGAIARVSGAAKPSVVPAAKETSMTFTANQRVSIKLGSLTGTIVARGICSTMNRAPGQSRCPLTQLVAAPIAFWKCVNEICGH
jgi:hypothetical protein